MTYQYVRIISTSLSVKSSAPLYATADYFGGDVRLELSIALTICTAELVRNRLEKKHHSPMQRTPLCRCTD